MRLDEIVLPDNVRQMQDEIFAETYVNPFAAHELVWENKACFELFFRPGGLHLAAIRSLDRGKGYGSEALRWLCALADKYGVTIDCSIQPFGQSKPMLNKTQLKAWYKRYGFRPVLGRSHLKREPKTNANI